MTKPGNWKRTVLAVAAMAGVGGLGGTALAESHSVTAPGQSVRAEEHRADLPRATLPMTVRHEETTYRVTGDECVGSVCARGVAVTTPAAETSEVGGEVTTPVVDLRTGEVQVTVTESRDSIAISARYGAIGVASEAHPSSLLPRH